MISAMRQHSLPAGNQTGKARLSATSLAELTGSPFEIVVWCGVHQPISAQRVLAYVRTGNTLPPSPGMMGSELQAIEEHERRVAWLYANPDTWEPVIVAQGDLSSPSLEMTDGHHRLAAALLRKAELEVLVEGGMRSHVSKLLSTRQGEWLVVPETEAFGTGVFPVDGDGQVAVRVYGEGGRCWVEDMATGECLARYGHKLWTVGSAVGDMPAASALGETALQRQAAIRAPGTSPRDHLEGFIKACVSLIGGHGTGLRDFIQAIVGYDEA